MDVFSRWYSELVYAPDTSRLTDAIINADRNAYVKKLESIEKTIKEWGPLGRPPSSFNFYIQEPPHFLLSYQHRNNRELFAHLSRVYRLMFPDVNFVAPHVKRDAAALPKRRFIRVGFISGRMSKLSSVMKDRLGIIQRLPRDVFSVSLVTFQPPGDDFGRKASMSADDVFCVETSSFTQARDFIASLQFDVVVFCELGFGPKTYALAHCRFAPVQLTTWGHSDTSGVSTIDHYVSSKLFEVPDLAEAQTKYSENLVALESLCTYYFKPFAKTPGHRFGSRLKFFFPEGANIYLLIQTPFKVVHDFLLVVADILKADPNGILVLTSHPADPQPGANNYATLASVLPPAVMARVRVMPWLQYMEGQNLIAVSDVLLDPYPFGGCNTSLESFHLGKPVVTMPATFIYGRFTAAFYDVMGIDDCVVTDFEAYKALAIRLGTDLAFRNTVCSKIRAASDRLFEDNASVAEWSEMLQGMVAPHLALEDPAEWEEAAVTDAFRNELKSSLLRFQGTKPQVHTLDTQDGRLTLGVDNVLASSLRTVVTSLAKSGFVTTACTVLGRYAQIDVSKDKVKFRVVALLPSDKVGDTSTSKYSHFTCLLHHKNRLALLVFDRDVLWASGRKALPGPSTSDPLRPATPGVRVVTNHVIVLAPWCPGVAQEMVKNAVRNAKQTIGHTVHLFIDGRHEVPAVQAWAHRKKSLASLTVLSPGTHIQAVASQLTAKAVNVAPRDWIVGVLPAAIVALFPPAHVASLEKAFDKSRFILRVCDA